MATAAWYLGRSGKQLGPYQWAVIAHLAQADKLSPHDLLWTEGQTDWARANTFDELVVLGGWHSTPAAPLAQSAPPDEDRRRGNYLKRHWRGQLSLPVSYWVNGTVVTIVCVGALALVNLAADDHGLGAVGTGALIVGALLITYLLSAWQMVGIWRSASAHPGRGGSRGWAVTAKVMVVFGLLGFAAQLPQQLPLWFQGVQLLAGREDIPKAQFRILNDATEIELSGGISFGSADALQTLLDATPTARVVHLDNVGGWVAEGSRIGKLIEARGLTTYTARECVSACLLAFLSGKERLLADGARLGFHQASVSGVGGAVAEQGDADFRAVFRKRGLPEAFIRKALATRPDDMWFPTQEELLSAGVVTAIVDP